MEIIAAEKLEKLGKDLHGADSETERKKIIRIEGLFKGLIVDEKDIAKAKKSLFSS